MAVRFESDGLLRPQVEEFDEAHRYQVGRVLDIRWTACQRVGGVGDRYTCRINACETNLWLKTGA